MNHKEAEEKALKSKWKVTPCQSGESCWCRMIEPEEKIEYTYGDNSIDEFYFIGAGAVNETFANYIVNLHNKSLEL